MRDEDDVVIRRVSETLRAPVTVSPGFDARVMAAVRAERAAAAPRALGWLTRTRTVRVRPLAALALAAGVAGLAVLGADRGRAPGPATPPVAAAPAAAPVRMVGDGRPRATRFALVAPAARSVALVGDFNDWDPNGGALRRGPGGRWELELPLAPGRYEYAFLVDGARVVPDPAAPAAAPSEFGAPNSVVSVGGGGAP